MTTYWDILEEVIKFLGYSALGFFGGYQVCKFRRNVEEIKEAVVSEHHPKSDKAGDSTRSGTEGHQAGVEETHPVRHSGWQARFLGIIVLFLALFTFGQSVYFTRENQQTIQREQAITECQAQFNEDFAHVVSIRAQWADEDRAQLLKMITAIILPDTSPQQDREAIQDWITVTKKNDQLRAQNPLPNLAQRNCDEKAGPR